MEKLFEKKLVLSCHPRVLAQVKQEFGRIADRFNIPLKARFKLELAIDEACINAIDHGSLINSDMNFEIAFKVYEDRLFIKVKDFGGISFDPDYFERLARKKSWGHGGRGIFLINQTMDEVMYCFNKGNSTTLLMIKYLESHQTSVR